MKFMETRLAGLFIIELEPMKDERGFFARSFCKNEFAAIGLDPCIAQCNISFNTKQFTLRGMHFQIGTHAEAKLIRCTRGSAYDVSVDIRPGSATYLKWFAVELNEDSNTMVYLPPGIAHGFLTLSDKTELFYQMSNDYIPLQARGLRWNDPAIKIDWPHGPLIISEKDNTFPDFSL